jgi:hypothetical protein
MKKSVIAIITISWLIPFFSSAQDKLIQVSHFDKIVASPFVNVVLEKGETESVRIEYDGINPEDVMVRVSHKKLQIYLDDARFVEKRKTSRYYGNKMKISRYQGNSITAYVTYKKLRAIEMRGDKGLVCHDPITADKFKLSIYGENDVTLASLQTGKFKASVFGANTIEVKSGSVDHQVYRLFGENQINTQNLSSNTANSRIYGTGRLLVNANDELKISAFGEPEIRLTGPASINKGIIIGEASIKVRR